MKVEVVGIGEFATGVVAGEGIGRLGEVDTSLAVTEARIATGEGGDGGASATGHQIAAVLKIKSIVNYESKLVNGGREKGRAGPKRTSMCARE